MNVIRHLSGMLLAGTMLAAASQPGWARTVLNLNSQVLENTVSGQIEKWFADEVTSRSDGELTIRVFFGEGLGKATESLSLLSDGAIEMASMSASYYPAELPLTSAPNSLPVALDNVAQSMALMNRLLDEVPAIREEHERNGIRALFFHNLNEYYLLSTNPLTTFDSLKGERMRTWGADMPRLASSAGAVPITIGLGEIYESLSSGAISVVPLSYDYIRDYRLYEVAKNISTFPAFVGPTGGVWISQNAWNNLDEDQQALLLDVADEALQRDFEKVTAASSEARSYLEEQGVTIHEFPEEEAEKWKSAAPDFFAHFVQTMDQAGKGEAARQMTEIWHQVRSGEN